MSKYNEVEYLRTGFDQYFAATGIATIYNTLGITTAAVEQYVGLTKDLVKASKTQRSQNVKLECYQRIVPSIKQRPKLTGFEQFVASDIKFRKQLKSTGISHNSWAKALPEREYPDSGSVDIFSNEIITTIDKFDNRLKLLYFSGGLDSELIATMLNDNKVSFVPIIFEWVKGTIVQNEDETRYAKAFCDERGVPYDIHTVDIEQLWNSPEFAKLATDLQVISPHITTHAHMVTMMNEIYPNSLHIFGGEVRYNTFMSSTQLSKEIVFATKLVPAILHKFGAPFDASPVVNATYNVANGYNRVFFMICGGGGGGGGGVEGNSTKPGGGGGGGGGGHLQLACNSPLTPAWPNNTTYTITIGGKGVPGSATTNSTIGGTTKIQVSGGVVTQLVGGGSGGKAAAGGVGGVGGYSYTPSVMKPGFATLVGGANIAGAIPATAAGRSEGAGGSGSAGPGIASTTQTGKNVGGLAYTTQFTGVNGLTFTTGGSPGGGGGAASSPTSAWPVGDSLHGTDIRSVGGAIDSTPGFLDRPAGTLAGAGGSYSTPPAAKDGGYQGAGGGGGGGISTGALSASNAAGELIISTGGYGGMGTFVLYYWKDI